MFTKKQKQTHSLNKLYYKFFSFCIKVHVHVIVYYYQILNHVNTITGTCRVDKNYVNMKLILVDMQHNNINMQLTKVACQYYMLHVDIINLFPLAFFRT